MKFQSIIISFLLAGSLLALAPNAAAQPGAPITTEEGCRDGEPGMSVQFMGNQIACLNAGRDGAAASFGLLPHDTALPVLVAGEGGFTVNVAIVVDEGAGYGSASGVSTSLILNSLTGETETVATGTTGPSGVVTFEFGGEDDAPVQINRLAVSFTFGGTSFTLYYNLASELLFGAGEFGTADSAHVASFATGTMLPVLMLAPGLPSGALDEDEDSTLDPVDNCSPGGPRGPQEGSPAWPDGQAEPSPAGDPAYDDQGDDDFDGIGNGCDADPEDGPLSGLEQIIDGLIDSDGDGVNDVQDECPDTPEDTEVEDNGCRPGEDPPEGSPLDALCLEGGTFPGCIVENLPSVDEDGDRVIDALDRCPGTEADAEVDSDGCAEGQVAGPAAIDAVCMDDDPDVRFPGCITDRLPDGDSDGDGVNDVQDQCPETAEGATVDEDGCADGQAPAGNPLDALCLEGGTFPGCIVENLPSADGDGDGVIDALDRCPDTEAEAEVDDWGCSTDQDPERAPIDDALCPTESGLVPLCLTAPLDGDGDGVPNNPTPLPIGGTPLSDNCPTVPNADQADMDEDGLGDVCDTDLDGDGRLDKDANSDGSFTDRPDLDNCPRVRNTDQLDTDTDGLGNACDDDDDNDTVVDANDNCILVANTDQANMDADAFGNACDTDMDGDSVADKINHGNGMFTPKAVANGGDNCPSVLNADQRDGDGDGVGDACDLDKDNDGTDDLKIVAGQFVPKPVSEGGDNCPGLFNPAVDHDSDDDTPPVQIDTDGDGQGNACDADDDTHAGTMVGDGIRDEDDNCPTVANVDQADLDGDRIGDVCDPDIDGDGVPNKTIGSDEVGTCVPVTTGTNTGDDRFPRNAAEWHDDDCDGVGNNLDPKPRDAAHSVDADGDGIANGLDNCPTFVNPDQKDSDNDGKGDVCDDSDGDGVADAFDDNDGDGLLNIDDNCPNVANANQLDGDGDGLGDACDGNLKNGPLGDLDGDGFTNAQEAAQGTNPNDATSFPGTTSAPALVASIAPTLRGTTTVEDGVTTVRMTFTPTSAAQGIQVLRSASPWQVIATLPATAAEHTDETATIGAKYIVIAYGSEGPVADPELEISYLETLVANGHYYEAKLPSTADGHSVKLHNGNGAAQQVEMVVEYLDAGGNVVDSKRQTVTVPAHGEASFEPDDHKGAAKYNVYIESLDGSRSLVGSGAIKEGPGIDQGILWLVAGGALLALILIVAIAGIIAYTRQEPEEVMA